ncbi:MAG: hypothetical protein A7315_04300 [Candidatus Altiarchaeales archaeon WOR_SM1_79]|nr:MAG: hypothetical protein A7315_04300 [Candidatus Altiarchaeales archaeon WOR_SM1_79]
MEDILNQGIDVIVAIQQVHGPMLDGVFRTITFMGGEEFYLLIVPLLFWCVDYKLGVRVAAIFLLSSYLNVGLKDLFQQPRPFDLNPGVQLSPAEATGCRAVTPSQPSWCGAALQHGYAGHGSGCWPQY